ncbi:MAG: PAS domain-containing sensor histidine kinase [Spirochaetota bacterium]|nr:PAS domain-containing sensor histidine kinase [Spirochaetota bacterium]
MDNSFLTDDLFEKERKVIENALLVCENYDHENPKLIEEYKALIGYFVKLAKETKKLVKLSDHWQRKLRESIQKYRSVTESAYDAIISIDSSKKIISWNKGAKEIFEYNVKEILGKSVFTLIADKSQEKIEKLFISSKSQISELIGIKKNKEEFPFEISFAKWKANNETFYTGIIRDITDRKRVEQHKEDVERIIKHDLKSPLNAINLSSQLLLQKIKDEKLEKGLVNNIVTSCQKMQHIIINSLALFKMEEGSYQLKPETLNLIEVFENLKIEFFNLLEIKSCQLIYILNGDKVMGNEICHLKGEKFFLGNLFSNLIKNAIEASPNDNLITVNINKTNIECVEIDIHNYGEIPLEVRNNFFDRYSTSGKSYGTGLGTFSALLIVKAHNGDIHFTSSKENGTHLIVKLPLGEKI